MPAGVLYDKSILLSSGIADKPSLSAALATMSVVPSIPSANPSPVHRPNCAITFDGEDIPRMPLTLLVIPLVTPDTASLTAVTLLLIPLIKPSITCLPTCNNSTTLNALIVSSVTPLIFSSDVAYTSSHLPIASSFSCVTLSIIAVFISFHLAVTAVFVCVTLSDTLSVNCVHKLDAVSLIDDHKLVKIDLAPSQRLCTLEIKPSTKEPI